MAAEQAAAATTLGEIELQRPSGQPVLDTAELARVILNETRIDVASINGFADRVSDLYSQIRLSPRSTARPQRPASTDLHGSNVYSLEGMELEELASTPSSARARTFITEVPGASQDAKPIPVENASRIIELASFPGFNEGSVTPLPNGVQGAAVLSSILSVHKLSPGFKKRLRKQIALKETTDLISDLFWWFYINHWQGNKPQTTETSKSLYSRIAETYVYIFLSTHERDRDEFVKNIPGILAHTLYQVFCTAYPVNLKPFDNETFKSFMTDTLYVWIAGVKMRERHWDKWGASSTAAPALKTASSGLSAVSSSTAPVPLKDAGGRRSSTVSRLSMSSSRMMLDSVPSADDPYDLISLMASTGKSEAQVKTVTASHYVGPLPPVTRVPFDIYGNSPIIRHYFSVVRNSSTDRKTSFIHSSQVERETEAQTSRPTYRELILESARKSRKSSKRLSQYQEAVNKERQKLALDVLSKQRTDAKEQLRLLSRPREIREAVDDLLERHKLEYGDGHRSKHYESATGRIYKDLKVVI
ncbi:hypothetical protein RI367_007384 [Sorochytrium milnesiophthora]